MQRALPCCRRIGTTETNEQVPQPWEVWHARFDFSERRGYKYRPVIVLATRFDGLLVAMVAGATNKLSLEHDYAIREWEAAGFDKPSIVRLDRIAEIPAGYVGGAGRIGRLAAPDITAIKGILIEITR